MGYIEQNLMVGERIVYTTKPHWIVYRWPAVFLLMAVVTLVLGYSYVVGGGYLYVSGTFILLAVLTAFSPLITSLTSEFGVTNKRVLVKVGLIRRHSLEVLLTKVEGIGVDQSIMGRILGYGSIVVTGTGGTREQFHQISAPFEFRKRVQEQIAAAQEPRGA